MRGLLGAPWGPLGAGPAEDCCARGGSKAASHSRARASGPRQLFVTAAAAPLRSAPLRCPHPPPPAQLQYLYASLGQRGGAVWRSALAALKAHYEQHFKYSGKV